MTPTGADEFDYITRLERRVRELQAELDRLNGKQPKLPETDRLYGVRATGLPQAEHDTEERL